MNDDTPTNLTTKAVRQALERDRKDRPNAPAYILGFLLMFVSFLLSFGASLGFTEAMGPLSGPGVAVRCMFIAALAGGILLASQSTKAKRAYMFRKRNQAQLMRKQPGLGCQILSVILTLVLLPIFLVQMGIAGVVFVQYADTMIPMLVGFFGPILFVRVFGI